MKLSELTEKYHLEEEELLEILSADAKKAKFFKEHIKDKNNLDSMTYHAIEETLEANLPETPKENFMTQPVKENVQNEVKKEPKKYDSTVVEKEKLQEETNNQQKEKKPRKKRQVKKKETETEMKSDIDMVSMTKLRKFYAENFNVKIEKIFYLDDETVKNNINEQYIVIERENDYIFIKRNANVVFVEK